MATVAVTLDYRPFFLQAAEGDTEILYSAFDMRRMLRAMYPRDGIIGHHSFLVTQAPAVGWSINVNEGYAMLGGYLVHMPADELVSLAAFNTSPTATRTHKVWLSVFDKLTTGSEYEAQIVVTEDTGVGAPSPTGAAVSMQLAHVSIANGQANIQNANINNTYKHSGAYDDPIALDPTGDMVDGNAEINTAPFAAREGNGIVRLSGAVRRSGSLRFQQGVMYTLATLTGTLRPKYSRWATTTCSVDVDNTETGTYTARINVTPEGDLNVYIPSGQEPQWILLDGVTYELD